MKKLICTIIVIALLSSVLVDAGSFLSGRKKVSPPQFSLALPRDNQNVIGDAMTVQVLATNVKIRSSANRANKPDEGHLKIIIDSEKPINAYTPTYRVNIANLDEGTHTLSVELVQNNGNSFEPALTRTSSFVITRSAVKGGNQPKVKKIIHPGRLFTEKRV